MNCKRWRWVCLFLAAAGALVLLVGFFSDNFWTNPATYIGVVLMLISPILDAFTVRCPACRRHISDHSPITAGRCPFCGAELEEGGLS